MEKKEKREKGKKGWGKKEKFERGEINVSEIYDIRSEGREERKKKQMRKKADIRPREGRGLLKHRFRALQKWKYLMSRKKIHVRVRAART